jgi:hypothetical protein
VPIQSVDGGKLPEGVAASGPKLSHLFHLSFCDLRVSLFSPCNVDSSLLQAIEIIVFVGPKEEMVGINAGRVIAMMADDHPLWNGPFMELPGDSMRQGVLTIDRDESISFVILGGRPFPTAVQVMRFVNFGEKSAFK